MRTGYAATTENLTGGYVSKPWNTTTGYLASITGNITGVYDMSGGLFEQVMGVLVDNNGLPLSGRNNSNNSGFNGTLYSGGSIIGGTTLPDAKYYDAYPTISNNTSYSNRILGDATG